MTTASPSITETHEFVVPRSMPTTRVTFVSLLAEARPGAPNSLVGSSLGRGLSTGSELEYADPDTIASALSSRA